MLSSVLFSYNHKFLILTYYIMIHQYSYISVASKYVHMIVKMQDCDSGSDFEYFLFIIFSKAHLHKSFH